MGWYCAGYRTQKNSPYLGGSFIPRPPLLDRYSRYASIMKWPELRNSADVGDRTTVRLMIPLDFIPPPSSQTVTLLPGFSFFFPDPFFSKENRRKLRESVNSLRDYHRFLLIHVLSMAII